MSPFAKLMSWPSPSFFSGILKIRWTFSDFFIEQTVTTTAQKFKFQRICPKIH